MKATLLSLFLLAQCLTAQVVDDSARIDSLQKIVSSSSGEAKIDAYRKLHFVYMENVYDDAAWKAFEDFVKEYTAYAEQEENLDLQGSIRINTLITAMRANRFGEVEKLAPQTLAFLKKIGMTDGYYVAYEQLILAYCNQGLFEKALGELQLVYQEAQQQNDLEAQFYMQYLMGTTCMYQDRLGEAETHYRQSIATAEKMSEKPFQFIKTHLELCNMLQATNQLDEFFALAKQTEALIDQSEKDNPKKDYSRAKHAIWMLSAYNFSSTGDADKAEYYCNRIDSLMGNDFVGHVNILIIRASIAEARKEYAKALEYANRAYAIDSFHLPTRRTRIRMTSHVESAPLTWAAAEATLDYVDSTRTLAFNAQLDALRTQYEVDKHIAEKKRMQNNFIFALVGCILLALALGIWIHYNRRIQQKNRKLAQQIDELTAQQELRDAELLSKASFVQIETTLVDDEGLCPESRMDKLCNAIRDIILKDKAYRNPSLTRDYMVSQLGTNRELFVEAFMHCFGMSFSEYINSLRLKDSILLLQQSDMSIEAISETTGFGTVRTFQRQFQAKYGMTAKDYRKGRGKYGKPSE